MVITRFAPSPTGDPHIGNIRTALFSYLFAKANQGKFLLRIEDTDQARYNEKSIGVLKDALSWLKITPENLDDPIVQSKRLEVYKKATLELVEAGHAYVCDCSKERLEKLREEQTKKGRPPMYDRHCRERELEYQAGKTVIRMKVPDFGKTSFTDLIRGEVHFGHEVLDDQILLKSDGFPTYHLAHAVDDHEMGTTHVIRGEEWISSTPKHILLFQMLSYEPPQYAHLPVILGPNKGKLSKRDGASGILEYRKLGYLPEALINFMVLLGWNPKTPRQARGKPEEEFFTLAELEQKFDLKGVNKAAAVFDLNKLNHFNAHYLQKLRPEDLKISVTNEVLTKAEASLLLRGGFSTTKEMSNYILKLKKTPEYKKEILVFRKPALSGAKVPSNGSTPENTLKGLSTAKENLEKIESWEMEKISEALKDAVEKNSLSNGDVFWPVRVALSGEEKSPSPEELALAIGKTETIERIKKAIEKL